MIINENENYVRTSKTTFEFDNIIENENDIAMCMNRKKLYLDLVELYNYRRELYKYENRSEIPVEEIINKLDDIVLTDFVHLVGID